MILLVSHTEQSVVDIVIDNDIGCYDTELVSMFYCSVVIIMFYNKCKFWCFSDVSNSSLLLESTLQKLLD